MSIDWTENMELMQNFSFAMKGPWTWNVGPLREVL